MKKIKKSISIIMTLCVLVSTLVVNSINPFAADLYEVEPNNNSGNADGIRVNQSISGMIDNDKDEDWFKFELNSNYRLKVVFSHEKADTGKWRVALIHWIKSYQYEYIETAEVYSDKGTFTFDTTSFPSGVYTVSVSPRDYYGLPINTQYTVSLQEYIFAPTNLKVSSRGVNSIKLSWTKSNGNVNGYQLQRNSGDTYKTVANTTATSYTVNELKSSTKYTFRVRAYKTVDGKKYYSSWKMLTTPTKPGKVSIKTPSTNSKHQIIAKWKTVTKASGYQVQYCKNKSCSNVIATKTASGQSKASYTGKNFTKGRTYYIRVRAYKTVNGTKYYGSWSSVKSIKCK